MADDVDPSGVAEALMASLRALARRVRQMPTGSGLTVPERNALACLDSLGPTTTAVLAREVRITAQAMGMTLKTLGDRGLIERHPDPEDGRRILLTVTEAGMRSLQDKRSARTELLARALTGGAFTPAELEQLIEAQPLLERLARTI